MPLIGLLFLTLTPIAAGDQQGEINRLIRLLGSPRFGEREAAGKQLEAIGEPAEGALRKAAKSSRDPEIRHRAACVARVVGKLNAVAGCYYLGNGTMRFSLQVDVDVDVDGHFNFAWTGCPGFNEQSKGTAKLQKGWLILTPEERHVAKGFASTPTEFLPLTWGSRAYLLAKDEFLDFCNAINQGREPRTEPDGLFCLRCGDWTTSVQGKPELPEEWAKYLLQKPLQGKIIEMIDARTGRLNLGETDGVRSGMILSAGRGGVVSYGMRVVSVEKGFCFVR
ncbi:MAG TPA: hypothetical protein VKI17_01795, partial [Gemmataceae bacterium]|nr:hypothetical protein [Gemmataceae bacterium]